MHNFSQSKNKFGYVYILTAQGVAEKALLTGCFLRRKLVEYEELNAEINAPVNEGVVGISGSSSGLLG